MDPEEFRKKAVARMAKKRSPLSPLFRVLCRLSWVRSRAIRTICRLEGGQLWSATFRELMPAHYGVEIGMHSYGPCLLPGQLPAGTRIGNYCSLAAGLQVLRRNHPVDRISQHPFFFNAGAGLLDHDTISSVEENPLTIGHDVWIGQNVLITPGCRHIGDSSVIASGAVVTADVPPFAIAGGVPAKLLRWRLSEELRAAWVQSQWWLKPVNELGDQLGAFIGPFQSDCLPELLPSTSEATHPSGGSHGDMSFLL